jgi:hypothetical protein
MWEIYAYHNTDALFGIFNAVAAIMGSAPSPPDLVLVAQPPAQPRSGVVVERPVRLADRAYLEVVRPAAQRAVQLRHLLRGLLPTRLPSDWLATSVK